MTPLAAKRANARRTPADATTGTVDDPTASVEPSRKPPPKRKRTRAETPLFNPEPTDPKNGWAVLRADRKHVLGKTVIEGLSIPTRGDLRTWTTKEDRLELFDDRASADAALEQYKPKDVRGMGSEHVYHVQLLPRVSAC